MFLVRKQARAVISLNKQRPSHHLSLCCGQSQDLQISFTETWIFRPIQAGKIQSKQ